MGTSGPGGAGDVRPCDPLDGEALPAIPAPPIDDAVTRRLARSHGEFTAWELHQATHERALQRRVDAIGLRGEILWALRGLVGHGTTHTDTP